MATGSPAGPGRVKPRPRLTLPDSAAKPLAVGFRGRADS